MSENIKQKMSRLSDTAKSNLNLLTIDMISNKEALINGCRGIIEYNESLVKINSSSRIITLEGSDLSIRAVSVEEIIINGEILRVEFSDC